MSHSSKAKCKNKEKEENKRKEMQKVLSNREMKVYKRSNLIIEDFR